MSENESGASDIDQLESGHALEEKGNFDQARDLYSKLIDKNETRDLYFRRGVCELELEHFYEADTDFSKAIKMGLNNEAVYALRANARIQSADFAGAGNDLDKALEFNPSHASYHLLHASCHLALGQPDKAIADYGRAIAATPSAEAYHARAAVLLAMRKPKEAIQDYDQAIEHDPAHVLSYMGRALAHQDLGQIAEAVGDFCFVLKIAPSSEGYLARGNAYMRLGLVEKAIADYDAAIELKHDRPALYQNRAAAHILLAGYGNGSEELEPKHAQAALADLDRAIQLSHRSAEPLVARARLQNAMKEYNQAVIDATKAIDIDSANATAYGERGKAYRALGKDVLADQDMTKADQLARAN